MGRELEYKFTCDAGAFEKIKAAFPGFREIRMQTIYFDTADGRLAKRHDTLRLRQENEDCICTLKTPLPDGSRGEWEVHTTSLEEGLKQLPEGLPPVQDLEAVCGARFTRLAATLQLAQAQVELALDRGVLLGGGREIPLLEVEVEYKSGSEVAAEAFAQNLARRYGLQPEAKSKFARASALTQK